MRRWPGVAALSLLLALPGVLARAQGIDLSHGGPIQVTARDGIQWLQQKQEVIASGDARAVRENVTVNADRLIAFYRKKQGGEATPAKTASNGPVDLTGEDSGGNEIYRLVAEGHVVISTPTDRAQGDRAVYDLDQAVLVLTGNDLKLTTPNDVLTAQRDLEYWSAKHMAVARGDAVVVTKDNRRLSADVLVAYTTPGQGQPAPGAPQPKQVAAKPGAEQDPLDASGKLKKVEAFGNVVVATPNEVVTGNRGVYDPETGIAILVDHVRITRGQNQLEGSEAEVNLKTGVARLLSSPKGRVEGLIVPSEAQQQAGPPGQERRQDYGQAQGPARR